MGDGEGSDPMSRAPIIPTPSKTHSRPPNPNARGTVARERGLTYDFPRPSVALGVPAGDLGAWNRSGVQGKYVPGPERRIGPDRRRAHGRPKGSRHTEHTSGAHPPWTQH